MLRQKTTVLCVIWLTGRLIESSQVDIFHMCQLKSVFCSLFVSTVSKLHLFCHIFQLTYLLFCL